MITSPLALAFLIAGINDFMAFETEVPDQKLLGGAFTHVVTTGVPSIEVVVESCNPDFHLNLQDLAYAILLDLGWMKQIFYKYLKLMVLVLQHEPQGVIVEVELDPSPRRQRPKGCFQISE